MRNVLIVHKGYPTFIENFVKVTGKNYRITQRLVRVCLNGIELDRWTEHTSENSPLSEATNQRERDKIDAACKPIEEALGIRRVVVRAPPLTINWSALEVTIAPQ